ncbi:transglutaminase family protein [Paracoccaceae bacterium Fryx2]|nr:transglutaminase family protein [Paracoccaceae bacterium Fryx2]
MLLTVDHVTRYRYDRPVRGIVQSHRLQPSLFDGQRVINWQVTVSDGCKGGGFRDGAGDWVQAWSVLGPVTEVEVAVRGTVETHDLAGVLRGHREMVPPECYLRDSLPTRADAALCELALVAQGSDGPLEAAHRLSGAVADAIAYRPGATQAHTTAAEALALGEGVCQDHAHALLAVARWHGLPGRYVSGYLMLDEDIAAQEAAHAWAEIWMPSLGWVGFDPANRCCPDDRYIRLGSGLDAQDAAPIRGTTRTPGAESLDVTVAVQFQQQ